MAGFIRLLTALANFCGLIAVMMVIAVMLLLCQYVLQNYVFGQPTTWQNEISTYLMISIAVIGAPYVLLTRGHICINVVPEHLSRSGRRAVNVFASFFSLAFCLLLAFDGFDLWWEALREGWVSDMAWGLPLWVPYLALPFGLGVLSLQYLADLLSLLLGHEAPFPGHGEKSSS